MLPLALMELYLTQIINSVLVDAIIRHFLMLAHALQPAQHTYLQTRQLKAV
jgi:hypothetical protein